MKQDNKLENNEVKQRILSYVYSSDYKPSAKLVDNIFEQFWFHDFYNSFISDEYVLKILISFLEATQPAIFNRYSFYKYYFETTTPTGLMSKLQQIGLAFEKQQVDAVPEAEYSSILSSLGISEEELGIEVLSRLHLANTGEREDQQLLIWSHHTLTEYLTTSYLLSQDDVIKATTQLVVLQQEGIVAFKPS